MFSLYHPEESCDLTNHVLEFTTRNPNPNKPLVGVSTPHIL